LNLEHVKAAAYAFFMPAHFRQKDKPFNLATVSKKSLVAHEAELPKMKVLEAPAIEGF